MSQLTVDVPAHGPRPSSSSSADSSLSSTPTGDTTDSVDVSSVVSSLQTSLSSVSSTPTRSYSGILRTSSLPLIPSTEGLTDDSASGTVSSSASSLNVTFAPLPQLAPRKRRSTTPLGVAARGQLMHRRRQMMMAYVDEDGRGPGTMMWTEEDSRELARRQAVRQPQEEGLEDPFVVLGRMVKGAWRKMVHKDKAVGKGGGEATQAVVVGNTIDVLPQVRDGEEGDKHQEEGQVSEDEVGKEFSLNANSVDACQAETAIATPQKDTSDTVT